MKYVVENTVPFKRDRKYPFADMDVGSSFAFVGDYRESETVRGSSKSHAKRYGKKFSIKKVGEGQYRCWRTA